MAIDLYIPFFTAADPRRAQEFNSCLQFNASNSAFRKVILLVDDDSTPPPELQPRVVVLGLDQRPTYADWVNISYVESIDAVSVLANADIFFDESINLLTEIFAHQTQSFVALSRYEYTSSDKVLHQNPQWSQDTWAFLPGMNHNEARDRALNFPLGVPRCDNKVAYIFGMYGSTIYNPCKAIKSFHMHESGFRSYEKKQDRQIVGGMAMVHASQELLIPSVVDVEVWPADTTQFPSVRINDTLHKWTRESQEVADATRVEPVHLKAQAMIGPTPIYAHDSVIAYDAHWQHPAITEEHAFRQIAALGPAQSDVVYLGFPWATLIDLLKHNPGDRGRISELEDGLERVSRLMASGRRRIATVCQHIHLEQFSDLLTKGGVTDVFWSHARRSRPVLDEVSSIAVHPFPLYPVQAAVPVSVTSDAKDLGKRYLYSFVGAKATRGYLSDARTLLAEELSNRPGGCIVERDTWHYNRVVYDNQILLRAEHGNHLVDADASNLFRDVMNESLFALCPSGTGPNSIRLWEAISSGVVPVVIADDYRPPCDEVLWDAAVVSCAEDRSAIRALPDRLRSIVSIPSAYRSKLAAGAILARRYGTPTFVHDLIRLMESGGVRRGGGPANVPAQCAA